MARNQKKIRQGIVVSTKMEKTGVILVERTVQHPLYKRTVRLTKKYKFHDEENACNEGDFIRVIECKPISKDKKWRLLEIVKRTV
ncbi:MAG: small subunit ribosomal protein S17 [bacterium]|jgi:small subunit ribosomal protein S17